jgi:hypothetical protein
MPEKWVLLSDIMWGEFRSVEIQARRQFSALSQAGGHHPASASENI